MVDGFNFPIAVAVPEWGLSVLSLHVPLSKNSVFILPGERRISDQAGYPIRIRFKGLLGTKYGMHIWSIFRPVRDEMLVLFKLEVACLLWIRK